jgi:hypothetical protein
MTRDRGVVEMLAPQLRVSSGARCGGVAVLKAMVVLAVVRVGELGNISERVDR